MSHVARQGGRVMDRLSHTKTAVCVAVTLQDLAGVFQPPAVRFYLLQIPGWLQDSAVADWPVAVQIIQGSNIMMTYQRPGILSLIGWFIMLSRNEVNTNTCN